MEYGVANAHGRPNLETAVAIVAAAWERGVVEFDTAPAYGDSESVLGECFRRLGIADKVRVVTKVGTHEPDGVRRSVEESMRRLGVRKIHGVMLHRQDDLARIDAGLERVVSALRSEGTLERFGVSVYHPEAALRALDSDIMDMVQVPANVLDRRFMDAGVFRRAAESGKRIYVRSVYLQGLLLMEPEDVPEHLARAVPHVRVLKSLAGELGLSRVQLALAYARQAWPEAMILIGAESPGQVGEGLAAFEGGGGDVVSAVEARISCNDETLLNPSMWGN